MKKDLIQNLLLSLLRFESLSGSESGIVEYIVDLLDKWNIDYHLQSISGGAYNIIVNNKKDPLITIATHLDTVQIYSYPKIKNGRILGTGSVDAKASVVTLLAVLMDSNINEHVSIAFFSDEEKGGSGSGMYLTYYKPRYGFILEPTELHICDKGFGALEGYINIVFRRYHPSTISFDDNNTIYRTMRILEELNSKLSSLGARFTPYFISCGNEDEYATPHLCKVNFDIGVPPDVNIEDIFKLLERLADNMNFIYMIREYARPFIMNDKKYLSFLKKIYVDIFGSLRISVMPSWTDANNFAMFGIPAIVFGPGSLRTAHSEYEEVSLNEILISVRFLKSLVGSANLLLAE